MALVGLSMGDL